MAEWEVLSADHRDLLGEGPLWSVHRRALLWVDIFGQAIQQIDLQTRLITRWVLPERIAAPGI